jgi:hypothetical protein
MDGAERAYIKNISNAAEAIQEEYTQFIRRPSEVCEKESFDTLVCLSNFNILFPRSVTLKLFFEFAKLFISSKFFKKLRNVHDISSLQKLIGHECLPMPPSFLAAEEESANQAGVPLSLSELFDEKYSSPKLIYDCITYLCLHGLETEGVFRVPGDSVVGALAMSRIKSFADIDTIIIGKRQPSSETKATSSTTTKALLYVEKVYDVASIMGKFLNSIPVPVFTFAAYHSIVDSGIKIEVFMIFT